ncbi:MAG TPA: ABC transporter ATP-binding protein, partial [Steroidobacteraceae bacterium]|nr:ABC transporter ATP-binding protein [Steroidobacteraceae bacterium]
DVAKLNDEELSQLRSESIGFVFQQFHLLKRMTAFENVELPLRYRGLSRGERQRLTDESLDRVGLSARARHHPAELSGGQQQRVAIARALAGSPRLLLADEPTGNLDTQMARGVMTLIEELHGEGATIVMVTHDPAIAARAQREIHILDGQIVDVIEPMRLAGAAIAGQSIAAP